MPPKVHTIPSARLDLLNQGSVPSSHLTEYLAIDFSVLLASTLPELNATAIAALQAAHQSGVTRRMAFAAQLIYQQSGVDHLELLKQHPSDTVRGWACYLIALASPLSFEERLQAIRPLADDSHFAVREWAWIALRPHLLKNLDQAITLLTPWTQAESERIRRFATEATRPRGVWCAHSQVLKAEPEKAIPILQPLHDDLSVYVQDSVSNWLNDASKDQANWVRELCAQWRAQSQTPATLRICKRALRSIGET